MLIEKHLVLPRASMTLVPTTTVTTAATTLPTISSLMSATTPWPSTSAYLFVTRFWPKPQNEENTPMSVLEEKQEVRTLDLSKYKIPQTRDKATSCKAL